jgi:hypothetical protein
MPLEVRLHATTVKSGNLTATVIKDVPSEGLAAPATQPTTRRIENHDEGKAWYWMLPDPFVLSDGEAVKDARTWMSRRRPEILGLFEREIYGQAPGRPEGESFEVVEHGEAFGGTAQRKQIVVHLGQGDRKFNVVLYLPAAAQKPVPVILCFSFYPLQWATQDPAVKMQYDRDLYTRRIAPGNNPNIAKSFHIDWVLAHGYGIAIVYYQEIDPDFAGGLTNGVRAGYLPAGQTNLNPDQWGTIAAWAWGASRAMDYLQTDAQVDGGRVAIMGHSRLGKTALWTGAIDPRFSMVFACSSGRGGASLARRNFGESIGDLAQRYGYQFCGNFQKYAHHEIDMPVDSHELIGLIAPRPIFLATASHDLHYDPMGEWYAAIAAGPIYELLGKQGLGTVSPPALDSAIMHDIGYHCHSGKHEVTALDWQHILQFADMHWGSAKGKT